MTKPKFPRRPRSIYSFWLPADSCRDTPIRDDTEAARRRDGGLGFRES
jgi:hypothetical protein